MRLHPLAVVAVLVAGVAGCATHVPLATPAPPLPELVPPPAPPRIVAIYVQPENPEPVEAAAPASASAPTRPAPRPATPPPPPPAMQDAETPAPVPAERPPALTLTPAPGVDAKTEASIRALLSRATRDLARVDVSALDVDRRSQFEAARRFVQQSEEALQARNLVYAGKLADKAASLAAVLTR